MVYEGMCLSEYFNFIIVIDILIIVGIIIKSEREVKMKNKTMTKSVTTI